MDTHQELAHLRPFKTLFEADANGREINIYRVKGQVATDNTHYPGLLLNTDDGLLSPIQEISMSLGATKYGNLRSPTSTIIMDEPVFFFVYNVENYYHFVYDTLPYLISYQRLKITEPRLKLLMQHPPQRTEQYVFVTEFLDILGIGPGDILLLDPAIQYNQLYISSSYTHGHDSNAPPRAEIYDFYRKITEHVHQHPIGGAALGKETKIYISRRSWVHGNMSNMGTNYTSRRRLENEDALVHLLIRHGYTEKFTELLHVRDTIRLFAQATHVIGSIGGGLANVVFCNPATHVQVLVSPTFLDVNKRFRYLFGPNTDYYLNSRHVENGPYRKYMRVRYHEGLGEVLEVLEDGQIRISWTADAISGFSESAKYGTCIVSGSELEPLDNGLNSSWIIDLGAYESTIV